MGDLFMSLKQLIIFLLVTFLFLVNAQEFSCLERDSEQVRYQMAGATSTYKLADLPWMVNLSFGNEPFCGGTLVNNTTVLTAAHCVRDSITVRRAAEDGSAYGEALNVVDYIIHPDYNVDGNVSPNDIALLKLGGTFNVTSSQLPRLLPKKDEHLWGSANDCAFSAGWGVTEESGSMPSNILLGADLPLWSHQECLASYEQYYNEHSNICAGYKEGHVSSCQGDSGGPLLVRGGPTGFIQVGIVSFALGCARPNYPGVYTRVSSFYDWIFEAAGELAKR